MKEGVGGRRRSVGRSLVGIDGKRWRGEGGDVWGVGKAKGQEALELDCLLFASLYVFSLLLCIFCSGCVLATPFLPLFYFVWLFRS